MSLILPASSACAATPRFRETNAVCIEARAIREYFAQQPGLHILAQQARPAPRSPAFISVAAADAPGARINICI